MFRMLFNLLLLLSLFFSPLCLKADNILIRKVHASIGPYLYQTDLNIKNPALNSPLLGGFGLLAQGETSETGAIEVAFIYMHKLYFLESSGQTIAEKVKRFKVTTGYRHRFLKNHSLGAFIFSSYSTGDPQIVHNDFSPANTPSTTARETIEYGLEASLQWEFWSKELESFVSDIRYSHSLTADSNENANSYGLMILYKREIPY